MKTKTLYIVKRNGQVLLETFDLAEATAFANKNAAYVEWWAIN